MKNMVIALAASAVLLFATSVFAGGIDGGRLYKRCQGCHGSDGSKLAMGVGLPLKGQSPEELLTKMKGYVDGSYGQNKKAIMTNIVKRLSDEQLKALADYIAGL